MKSNFIVRKSSGLLKERNAVMVAHYYADPEIQQLAEETGGCISDSLEMARFRREARAASHATGSGRAVYGSAKSSAEKPFLYAYPSGGMFALD